MEDLSSKLAKFGFSTNQAKTYLAIAYSGCTTIRQISETTNIHPQDIYKIIKELQKKGIVQKTLNKPVKVEAVPLKKFIALALSFEKQKLDKKFAELKRAGLEIESTLNNIPEKTKDPVENEVIVLRTHRLDSAQGRIEKAFNDMHMEYDAVFNLFNPEFEGPENEYLRKRQDKTTKSGLAKRGVKVRIILMKNESDDTKAIAIIKRVIPCKDNCQVKILERKEQFSFAIIDSKEVWIPLLTKKNKEEPSALVTDNKSIVDLVKYSFETLWNDPKAKTYYRNPKDNNKKSPT